MIPLQSAWQIVMRHRRHRVSPKTMRADLAQSRYRVLAEDVRAVSDAPAFDRSLFDGYAVRASDVKKAGAALRIIEEVPAGKRPREVLQRGTCAAIATGAMLPKGADAVAKKEDVWLLSADCAVMQTVVKKGENFTRRGSYFKRGASLLRRGASLDAARIGLLASQGVTRVRVLRPPRVAVLSTGDEIVEAGRAAGPTQVRNASAPMLLAALDRLGIKGLYLGCVKDRPAALKKRLAQGLRHDVLVVTGAVSMGRKDYVPAMLRKLGVRILFHKVRIRPGKPVLFGTRGRCAVFGLPGNAVSSLVTFLLFVKPVLERLMGRPAQTLFEKGVLAKATGNDSGRLSFLPGRLKEKEGRPARARLRVITPLRFCDSSDLRAAAEADVFYVLKETQAKAGKGTAVPFLRIPL